jgi:hypothetical protein
MHPSATLPAPPCNTGYQTPPNWEPKTENWELRTENWFKNKILILSILEI